MKLRRMSILSIICPAAVLSALDLIIGCPFRLIFGVPCPGCGVTRAWLLFVGGHWTEAFDMHPLFLVMTAFVAALIVRDGHIFRSKNINRLCIAGFILLVLCVYAARMCFLYPDTEPLVYNSDAIVNKILILMRWKT